MPSLGTQTVVWIGETNTVIASLVGKVETSPSSCFKVWFGSGSQRESSRYCPTTGTALAVVAANSASVVAAAVDRIRLRSVFEFKVISFRLVVWCRERLTDAIHRFDQR